ncbi:MAG: ATP-grasp domain-containing protein [Methanobacterium sp.]
MKILILEYASASGIHDPSICAEGYAMLEGLIDDFKSKNADYLLSENSHFEGKYCNPVWIKGDLMNWLNENIESYDACLLIAPEEDFILYKITELIEKKNVEVIGSSLEAVKVCSDKYLMYEALKKRVKIIETEKVFFDELDYYTSSFNNAKKIVKPADGVSCSGISIVKSLEEVKKAAGSMQTNLPYFILQDFVEGVSTSVSLLSNGEEAIPLSLNLQNIEFGDNCVNYGGGEVPFEHEMSFEAKRLAKHAVESIKGLKGYVGVDVILGDAVYIVEINSRITTPYVALKDVVNFNLGEAILDSVYGIFPSKINLNGKISFYKEHNHLKIIKE